MKRSGVAIGVVTLLAAIPVRAGEPASDHVVFEGAIIEGTVAAPAGVRVESRAASSFEPMIFERSSFREEMADALPDVEKAPVRLAQAGTVDPCHDEIYLSLRAKPIESLSDREFEIFKAKDQACNDARVRSVATPAPSPTGTPAPTVVVPSAGEFQPAPQPTPAPQTPARRFAQPWGPKEILLITFGAVALLLLMMGGMLLLLAVLAG